MRILRSRETRNFVYLLVQCTCGRRFGHREDRSTIACFNCGRVADLKRVRVSDNARRRLMERRRKARRLLNLAAAKAATQRTAARRSTGRRVTARA
jgi:hypothetical protein